MPVKRMRRDGDMGWGWGGVRQRDERRQREMGTQRVRYLARQRREAGRQTDRQADKDREVEIGKQRPEVTERQDGESRRERWGPPAETEMKRKQRDLGRDGAEAEIRRMSVGWR